MYKIEAFIRPERLDEVKDALIAEGYEEFTVLDAHGHGSQRGPTMFYRGSAYTTTFVHQFRVEVRVPDSALNLVVDAIVKAAHTGKAGDGKIFVTDLADEIEISIDRCTPARKQQSPPPHSPQRPRLATTTDAAWPRS